MQKFEDKNYDIAIKLTNFFGARLMPIENEEGFLEECLVIPLERNGLKPSPSKNVYANVYMTKTMNGCVKGWTHYLRMKVKKDTYAKLKSLGYEVPYLGNAKPSSWDKNLAVNDNRVKNIL